MGFLSEKSGVMAAALGLAFMLAAAPASAQTAGQHTKKAPAAGTHKPAKKPVHRTSHQGRELASTAESYILIDGNTGKVLGEKNADALHYPASTTKILTLMCVWDAIKAGRLALDSEITVSRHAASMVPTKLGVPAGGRITVRDAMSAVAVASSNDMAVALAEAVSGTEGKFAEAMNSRAAAIGMKKSKFYNASGLPDDRQVTTARDMGLLAETVLTDYKDLAPYFGLRSFTYKGVTHLNHNHLVSGDNPYEGMDFGKTGFFRRALSNLVASAQKDDDRVLAVILRAPTAASRDNQMRQLLDQGFEILTEPKDEPVPDPVQPPPLPAVPHLQPS